MYTGVVESNRFYRAKSFTLGCVSLDNLIIGGFREGKHYKFIGNSKTGKTAICLQTALQNVLFGSKVLYLNAGGSFSIYRIEQMYYHLRKIRTKNMSLREILSDITILDINNINDALIVIDQINRELKKADEISYPHLLSLIVIDSFAYVTQDYVSSCYKKKLSILAIQTLSQTIYSLIQQYSLILLTTMTNKFMEFFLKLTGVFTYHDKKSVLVIRIQDNMLPPFSGARWFLKVHKQYIILLMMV